MQQLSDFLLTRLDGSELALGNFQRHVVLVVNTASQCGFTPQYAGLEDLQRRYAGRGFTVIGCPCNQFGAQEPGDASAIGQFCESRFRVTFPLSAKLDVNGESAHPLFRWLTESAPGLLGTEAIKWNFTKFLIGRDGRTVQRFPPTATPESLIPAIDALLMEPI